MVLKALLHEFRAGCSQELFYADDLVPSAELMENFKNGKKVRRPRDFGL